MKRIWLRTALLIVLMAVWLVPVKAEAKECAPAGNAAVNECRTAEAGTEYTRQPVKAAVWDQEPVLTTGAEQSQQESSGGAAVGKDGSVIPAGWVEIGAGAILIVAVIVVAHNRKEKQKNNP